MKYDFILFEQLYTVENHYKDLGILAKLLKASGYRVAIADVFKERDLCKIDGIPHIPFELGCPEEFKMTQIFQAKKPIWKELLLRIKKDIYLYKVVKKLSRQCSHLYMGSFTLATPVFFLNSLVPTTTYYMWALRSSAFLKWKRGKRSFFAFISKLLCQKLQEHTNLRLIVSNELIRMEFLNDVGIKSYRLILRPERVIPQKRILPLRGSRAGTLKLLFIGTLRPSKNVEFCIKALKQLNCPQITYTIAGRCKIDQEYNRKIQREISNLSNVYRIDRYITDEEYNNLIESSDFLILCDKEQDSCASNGTMTEALLSGRPIIAPNINPFKYEVENFGVGLLYEYGNIDSLCRIILKALNCGAGCFQENILKYQDQFLESEVAMNLKRQIDNYQQ